MPLLHRYDRNHQALSDEEQGLLARSRVAVVGSGGLGGMVVEDLARIGVGHIRIIDADVFEESNLNRQIACTEADLGREKAIVAVERVAAVNSEVEAEPVVAFVDESNAAELIAGCDCVVDCLDNLAGRFWTAHACQQLGIPLAYGAISGWFGQVCTIYPGDISFAAIYGDDLKHEPANPLGNLPFTAHTTAAFQAAEVVKVLLNRPGQIRNRLLMIDLLGGTVDDIELR